MKRAISLILLCNILAGCVGAFIAGAAAGGLIVYDRRSIAMTATDTRIRHNVIKALKEDGSFANSHIVVSSFHQMVLLAGQTPLASLRAQAERVTNSVPDIKKIYNEIEISSPSSNMTRSSDTWVTTKVKSKMLATKGLHSGEIKVVTENGVVFLMGIVTKEQSDLAVDVARRVSGVQKIVKVFRYKRYEDKTND